MKARVVVSAVIKKDDEYLFGHKKTGTGPYPNTWHLIGGGVDLENETLEEAIKREIVEEAGIEVENLKRVSFDEDNEPNKHVEMTHYVFLVFQADYKSGELNAGDDINELKWVSKDNFKTLPLTRPSIKLFKELGLI